MAIDTVLRVGIVALDATAPWLDALHALPNVMVRTVQITESEAPDELATLAAHSDIVLFDVPDETRAVHLLGDARGLTCGAHAGLRLIDFGSLSPTALNAATAAFAARSAVLYGAAWGLPQTYGARPCRLYVDDGALDDPSCVLLLETIAAQIYRAGKSGAAKALAIVEQLLLAVITLTSAETLALGSTVQLPPNILLPLLHKGSGANALLHDPAAATPTHGMPLDKLDMALQQASALADQTNHSLFFGTVALSALRCVAGATQEPTGITGATHDDARDALNAAYSWFRRYGAHAS